MQVPVKKNEEYIVDIIDNGFEGEGIAKIDGFTIFIPKVIKGEKVRIVIVKVLASHGYGKLLEILEESKNRQKEECTAYKRCGGCSLRHVVYEETLNIKQKNIENLVNKTFGKNDIKVEKVIGMGNPYNYRNKAQFPIGLNKKKEPVFGFFAERTHEIIPIKDCEIHSVISEQIMYAVYKFVKENNISVYDEEQGEGLFRHVIVKNGLRTGEIMCVFVINGSKIPKQEELIEMLVKRFNVKTIIKNINTKNTNVILGDENIVIHGDGFIYDILGDYTFKISANSFYQVNPVQAEVLYNTALEMAELDSNDILFDLYCGIGTIGIFASKYVKKVYGIEIVENAVKDAIENAKINNIDNIEFLTGDVEKSFETLMKNKQVYPDVVVVDPPRKGLDNNTINNLLAVEPKKIVYISCNPATLVRDLKLLSDKYEFNTVTPVDMFPYTSHIENIAILKLR